MRRGRGDGSWHQPGDPLRGRPPAELRRIAGQAARDGAGPGHRIDTDDRTPAEVASLIVATSGWLA
jgi:hypothetical protein